MDNTEIQQSVGYSYPQLKPTEIVQCMEELGISLTKDELLEPQKHKDKIRNIFVQLVGSPSFLFVERYLFRLMSPRVPFMMRPSSQKFSFLV
jgi:hypothetical protein